MSQANNTVLYDETILNYEERMISYYEQLRDKYPVGSHYWEMFKKMADSLKGNETNGE